jgi:hypothetical protein
MTVFASKEAFRSLGLEQIEQSHAHASQDCTICIHPLSVHPTHSKDPRSKLHTAVRIAACGHIVGEECLDAWLDVGHTCPTCTGLLFEATGDPITQQDIDNVLRALSSVYGENAVMAVVARLMVRQEQEHARMRQAHEIELERMKKKEKEARNDGLTLSDDDFLDSDEEMDFGEDDEGVFEMDEETEGSEE